ncbi:MAG TPA: PAS domain-containing protein [Stellaceae bacterium]|nr:PAS domain-containing protein [Stellaceae bacterium]
MPTILGRRTAFDPAREETLFRFIGPIEAIPRPELRDRHRLVLDYWLAKRGTETMPRRADIDPADLVKALPSLVIWEAYGTDDFRCRLAGTEVCLELLKRLEGILLSQIPCPLLSEAQEEFRAVSTEGKASLIDRTLGWLNRPHMHYRHLLLPLRDNQGAPRMLLGVVTFHRRG